MDKVLNDINQEWKMEEFNFLAKLCWIFTYSNVIASPGQNNETAVMEANTAVHRFHQCWPLLPQKGGQDGRSGSEG
jgi:hypothetical protein